MPIKRLTYDPLEEKTRCSHTVQIVGEWARKWRIDCHSRGIRRYSGTQRPDQCTHNAVLEVDGTPLCSRHAGILVIDKYLNGDLIEKEQNND